MSKKKAFTLAEVIISLGIIGIVAAMTLPTIINNTQHQSLVRPLQRAYANVTLVFQAAMAADHVDNVIMTKLYRGIVQGDFNTVQTELSKYMKISKACPAVMSKDSTWNECFGINYTGLNNRGSVYPMYDKIKVISTDGIAYYFNKDGTIEVDVNANKGPNQYGRDLFEMKVDKDGAAYFEYSDVWLAAKGWANNGQQKNYKKAFICGDYDNVGRKCGARIIDAGWKMDY